MNKLFSVKTSIILVSCIGLLIMYQVKASQFKNTQEESGHSPFNKMLAELRTKFSDVKQITTDELYLAATNVEKSKYLLIDTRSKEEFQVSHLKDAINIETAGMIDSLLKDVNKDKPIVVYCSVGYRSNRIARELKKKGYNNVQNLEGSIFAWVNEGKEIFRDGKIVHEVHPYDEHWGQYLRKRPASLSEETSVHNLSD